MIKNKLAFYFPRSGYHSLKSFDQTFHLEKRWKLVREMGSGAYGVVMSVLTHQHPVPLSCLPFPFSAAASAVVAAEPFVLFIFMIKSVSILT